MKAFIFSYSTNYNLGVAIIYAETKQEAIKLAKSDPGKNYIWDNFNIYEIDLTNKSQIIIVTEHEFLNI